ncbi:MAG TPA: TonB-dependent receptor [Patescibacteria group bacterium]|nr:TonB-dependent receptor [Patescibacteria group bacterium]
MKKHWKKKLTISATVCCLTWPLAAGAQEQPQNQEKKEFSLDDVTVTAMRYASKTLDTPADVSVYTHEELKSTGAVNLIEALKYQTGLTFNAMGRNGQAWGGMTSEIIIRGVDDGTLVMLNGVPINMNGGYNLEQIPLDIVEKVEVVKGGGAVLYGSEAFGGVINIITKEKVNNSVSLATGTHQQEGGFTLQTGKASIIYNYSQLTEGETVSDVKSSTKIGPTAKTVYYRTAFGDSQKNNFNWNYRFDDHWNFNYMYSKDDYDVLYKQDATNVNLQDSHYNNIRQLTQLSYKENGWETKLFYNTQDLDSTTVETARPKVVGWSDATYTNYGLDVQKNWEAGKNKWLMGVTYQKEEYQKDAQSITGSAPKRYLGALNNVDVDRNHYSVYGQWETPISAKTRLVVSAREDVLKTSDGQKFTAFCPQIQTITKINDYSSWYTNVGKSFKMPTYSQLYYSTDNFIGNPGLQPETSMNYEIGYKEEHKDSSWKVALFKIDMENKIDWVTINTSTGQQQAQNMAGFRNTGIEVNYNHKLSDKFSYSLGGSFSNPEAQSSSADPWERTMGRIQLSGSLNYKLGPTSAALSAVYYGDRSDAGKSISPFFPVALHISRNYGKQYTLNIDIENLLNRRDPINNSASSLYYAQGRAYKVGFTAHF